MDLLSLGLNIDGFSEEKRKKLEEFIDLFKKLEEFDGKIFVPGGTAGLTSLNSAIEKTNSLLDQMLIKMESVSNSKIAPSGDTGFQEVASDINKATKESEGFTKSVKGTKTEMQEALHVLKSLYNQVRIISYILPGIGVSGVFEAIFTALLDAGQALSGFNNELEKTIDYETKQNKLLETQVNLMANLNKEELAYIENLKSSEGYKPGDNIKNVDAENKLIRDRSRGLDDVTLATDKVRAAEEKLNDAKYNVNKKAGFVPNPSYWIEENFKQTYDRLDKERAKAFADIATSSYQLKGMQDQADEINRKLKDAAWFKFSDNVPGKSAAEKYTLDTRLDLLNKEIEKKKTSIELSKANFADLDNTLNKYSAAKKEKDDADEAAAKIRSDEERKMFVSNLKEKSQLTINENKLIESDARSTYENINEAIRKTASADRELARASLLNITGTKENPNESASKEDIIAARVKYATEVTNIDNQEKRQLEQNQITFYQRRLKAQTESQTSELEKNAILNERIYQDENENLDKRLAAYNQYIQDKIKMQDLQLSKDLQAGASGPGGKTSLTAEEQKALIDQRNTQVSNVTADAKTTSYDIVLSSLKKKLSLIQDSYSSELKFDQENYIKSFAALNDSLDRKEITIAQYKKKRLQLEKDMTRDVLTEEIARDEQEKKELEDFIREKLDIQIKEAKVELDAAKAGGNQAEIDKAQGKYDALIQGRVDFEKLLSNVIDKWEKDRLAKEKTRGGNEDKTKKESWQMALKFEKEALSEIKTLVDQEYEYRISMVEKYKQLIDEQYGYEISRIKESSLSLKDKNALEIQLNEQKAEKDKNAQMEEKRLKIKEAQFNKRLAIAQILINANINAAKDLGNPGKMIFDEVEGAVLAAVTAAIPIPSFKTGVKGFTGGIARFGEDGAEIVKMPSKDPFLALKETISYLPPGTDVVPISDRLPFEGGSQAKDSTWEQFEWLAKQINRNNKQIKNVFRPNISIDLGFDRYKREILGR